MASGKSMLLFMKISNFSVKICHEALYIFKYNFLFLKKKNTFLEKNKLGTKRNKLI